MTEIAEAARGLPDARVRKLVDWIRENMCPDLPPLGTMQARGTPARWNDTRIIIFTEYDDTKRYLQQQLTAAIATTDRAAERIAVYHGPTPPAEREEIKRAFTTNPKKNPLRILIATDAAREGLNLQTHCWNLFHFDVPWNPSRMEQRNGRIDRKLQPNAEVYCHYFVYTDRKEDRILSVLVKKTETDQARAGQPLPGARRPPGPDAQARHPPPRHRRARERTRRHQPGRRQPAGRRGGAGRGARASGRPEGRRSSASRTGSRPRKTGCPCARTISAPPSRAPCK